MRNKKWTPEEMDENSLLLYSFDKTSVITLSRLQTYTAADLLLEEHGTAVSVRYEE